jgi:hypothetical protein
MVAAAVTHPVDTLKVRLQLQGELSSKVVSGNILRTIITEEGILVLYKGLSASLLREASYSTIRMGLYQPFKDLLRSENERSEPLVKKIFAGIRLIKRWIIRNVWGCHCKSN